MTEENVAVEGKRVTGGKISSLSIIENFKKHDVKMPEFE